MFTGIDAGLFAKTRRPEERKGLKCSECGLAFRYSYCAAGNWKKKNHIILILCSRLSMKCQSRQVRTQHLTTPFSFCPHSPLQINYKLCQWHRKMAFRQREKSEGKVVNNKFLLLLLFHFSWLIKDNDDRQKLVVSCLFIDFALLEDKECKRKMEN